MIATTSVIKTLDEAISSNTIIVISVILWSLCVVIIGVVAIYSANKRRRRKKENNRFDLLHRIEAIYEKQQRMSTVPFRKSAKEIEVRSEAVAKVYGALSEIMYITNHNKTKLQPFMDKYEKTFEILLEMLERLDRFQLLESLETHAKVYELLEEPLNEIRTFNEMELTEIHQKLESEITLLKQMREKESV